MATSTPLPSHSVSGGVNPLTLPAGMTAGIGPEQQYNNPYPPEQYGGAFPQYKLRRSGILRRIPFSQLSNTGQTNAQLQGTAKITSSALPNEIYDSYWLNFLYNPNEIDVSFSIDASNLPTAGMLSNKSGIPYVPAPGALTGQQITWTLFFNRTYDMIKGTPGSSRGVLQDVAAFYNVLGTFSTYGITPILLPVQVMFGMTSGDSAIPGGAIWGFTGFITTAQITYGQFRYDMIPSMAEIAVTMSAMYLPLGVPSSDPPQTGAGKTAQQIAAVVANPNVPPQISRGLQNQLATNGGTPPPPPPTPRYTHLNRPGGLQDPASSLHS
jgi:hypothetical protein